MKNIDVIIPTMLCSNLNIFCYTLNELKHSKLINKIIIIDNIENNDFEKNFLVDDDFILLKPNGNIFVNPAWNLGIKHMESEYYIILNDDILLKGEVIDLIHNSFLKKEDMRLLYVHMEERCEEVNYDNEINVYEKYLENLGNQIKINVFNSRGGSFVMGRKDEWVEIPNDLKIFCGDDYIFDITEKLFPNKKNYQISPPLLFHYVGRTISKIEKLHDYLLEESKILVEKYFSEKKAEFYKERFSTNHINFDTK